LKYVPPFDFIRRSVAIATVKGELRVSMGYDDFVKLIKLLLAGTVVDEQWYLRQYEDVRTAIEAGDIVSAQKHFIEDGYFEGRMPFPMAVDNDWYLSQYPDVAEGIGKGTIVSAEQHFFEDGYREGRFPAQF
jgi:hypothetical protein